MNINAELHQILSNAYQDAKDRKHEYITPEHVLYASLFNDSVIRIIYYCGGDPQRLQHNLESFLNEHLETLTAIETINPTESIGLQNIFQRAAMHCYSAGKNELNIHEFLVALFDEQESFAAYYLNQEGITRLNLLNYISHGLSVLPEDEDEPPYFEENTPGVNEKNSEDPSQAFLERFTEDMIAAAKDNAYDPLIGREDILQRSMIVLCRRLKNNPILVGEPGVGKTAIAEGLAQKIASGNVPKKLKHYEMYSVDMGALLAGTKFRGDFEDRLKKLMNHLLKRENVIIVIDEIHTIIGAGAVSGGTMDASNILKPIFAKGQIRCIGTTTYEEYKRSFNKDQALARRFQMIDIPEPSIEETEKILQGLKHAFESYHQVKYSKNALHAAAELSAKYINDRWLPDKAIDILDEAGSLAQLNQVNPDKEKRISKKEIEIIVAKTARIPKASVSVEEKDRLKQLQSDLGDRILGQEQAVTKVVQAIKIARAGFHLQEKPVASLLFVGPTGVGKTELTRQLADLLDVSLHRFDMSEYQERHTVARLIGAPPGYVGYDQGGLLTEAIRRTPHAVLLLDEIEKAHSDVFNILLQIMDYATLTDNNGKKADFRNVIIIMTSNAGARDLGKIQLGFNPQDTSTNAIDKAVKKTFAPEFINRLDAVVQFNKLSESIIKGIVSQKLHQFAAQLKTKQIVMKVSDEVIDYLADQGFSPEYGARAIDRLIHEEVKSLFIDEVLFGKLSNGGTVQLEMDGDTVIVSA